MSFLLGLLLICSPTFAKRVTQQDVNHKRELTRALRDAKTHMPKMERVVCLLQGSCTYPQVQSTEQELSKAGQRLRDNSRESSIADGLTVDVPLPGELNYLSPGTGVRVRALSGTVIEVTFFREPLSRRGVVVYAATPSEPLNDKTALKPKWWFGYQK